MLRALRDDPSLDAILAAVSRSFYLSLSVVPRAVRAQLSIAYLIARAADSIADTRIVQPPRRRELLGELRRALSDESAGPRLAAAVAEELLARGPSGESPSERRLLEHLGGCLASLGREAEADRARTRRVLDALITGMERDLERFVEGELRALRTIEELDEHTYFAAGCVGEFWTEMTAAHLPVVRHLAAPELVARGVRLGKALQLVNVIRDAPADLAAGRCYLPAALLERHGLTPADLLGPERVRARPVLDELRALAIDHVDAAWYYVMAIPRRAPRLRLACIWPLWIGLATLERIGSVEDPLAPGAPIKIARREVRAVIAESVAAVGFEPLLKRRHWNRRVAAARTLSRTALARHGLAVS
jgi:farnesyl-diphosphate farnesyltransferase